MVTAAVARLGFFITRGQQGGYCNLYIDPLIWDGDVPRVQGPSRAPQPMP